MGPSVIPPEQLEPLSAEKRLVLINDTHSPNGPVALTVSMQKPACVLLHMIAEQGLMNIRPIFIDTQFHFPETHQFLKDYEKLLGLPIRRIQPTAPDIVALEKAFRTIAPFNIQEGADACCNARKVLPLLHELSQGYVGRISGLMRSEGAERSTIDVVNMDKRLQPAQPLYHPLFDWTDDDIDSYLSTHDLPRHPLYEKQYASIGCFPCTTPLQEGETDPRAGRWRHLRIEDQAGKTYCSINPTDQKVEGGEGI
jgi:phosphoadenosine phosphosulfate reductase